MRPCDVILLAGGNGTRHPARAAKPLTEVRGESLIGRLARQAARHASRVVVVCAPVNAELIVREVEQAVVFGVHQLTYVIQPRANGPGDAVARGLGCVDRDGDVIISVSDNWVPDGVWTELMAAPTPAITARGEDDSEFAALFTRVQNWLDPVMLRAEEGPEPSGPGPWQCWCGPLKVDKTVIAENLIRLKRTALDPDAELKLGPALTGMPPAYLVDGNGVVDIGAGEAAI